MSWIQCVQPSRPRRLDGSWKRSRQRQKVRSRQNRSSRSLCARKGGSKQRNVFTSATRGTQHELVPMRRTFTLTCLQCGTVTQGKREEPLVKSPETCPHVNTDARGSSSTTHRVYCKDCGQYVYECPQSEWRQQQNETRGNLLRGRTERIDFSRGGERVTRAEVSELIHSFPQALRLFLRQRPDEEFDFHQNKQVFAGLRRPSSGKRRRLEEHQPQQR